MASDGISGIILFIGALLVAASVFTVLTTTVTDISGSASDAGDQLSTSLRTDITIISDSGSGAVYNDTTKNVTILVKNTGDETLAPDKLTVLVDGKFHNPDNTTLLENKSVWRPGTVLRVTVSTTLQSGEHRIYANIHNSKDVLKVNIP